MNRLFSTLTRGVNRNPDPSLADMIVKGAWVLAQAASAPFYLRSCDRVGRGARTIGRPIIVNRGCIEIGERAVINSRWSPVEFATGPDGRIEIGRRVLVNFGTLIAAKRLVKIGDGVQMGQYVVLSDTEVPEPVEGGVEEAMPVEIGEDVWLAGRVTVLPGARIGAGSVITAGSIVSGDIPPGVVAGGIPARVLRIISEDAGAGQGDRRDASFSVSGAMPAPSRVPAPASPRVSVRGLLLADFTVADLARCLADPADEPVIEAEVGPFGQVAQSLMQGQAAGAYDFALVWTRPEGAIPSFLRVLGFERVEENSLLAEVDEFCSLVMEGCKFCKHVFVPTWTLPPWRRGLGMLEGREGGAVRALAAMNLRLMDRLAAATNVFVLDAQRWVGVVGRGAQSPKAWYMGKLAFQPDVLAEAARDIKAAMRGITGGARKLVVLDLDDTLWGGIVGDVGWQNLRLGGHDSVGEAYVGFQRALKDLTRRGVVLGIASKNEESVAIEAIRSHPEMVLRMGDFVGWRINWGDKAANIADLAAELNLGLQSVVFIDDNPVERARVRDALPEVLVPEWPEDKLLYDSAIAQLRCFDAPAISREDTERTQMYASERRRADLKSCVGSLETWLEGLNIQVRVDPLGPANLARAAQLLNKTNQMNLSARRLAEQELQLWVGQPGRALWTVSVSDRFGDAGLTGIVSLEAEGKVGRIVDFVLSCRVMGRKVEESMVHLAVETARTLRLETVEARVVLTDKNKPCQDFWKDRAGFEVLDGGVFRWNARESYPLPPCIHLEWKGAVD